MQGRVLPENKRVRFKDILPPTPDDHTSKELIGSTKRKRNDNEFTPKSKKIGKAPLTPIDITLPTLFDTTLKPSIPLKLLLSKEVEQVRSDGIQFNSVRQG